MRQPIRLPTNYLAQGSRLKAQGNNRGIYLEPSAFSLQRYGGQSTLEYAVFIAVVAAALMAMQTYVKRSIQANLKTVENQLNAEPK